MFKYSESDYVQDPRILLLNFSHALDTFESANPNANTGDWTKGVQAALKQLAHNLDVRIEHLSSAGTTEHGTGEFLLDAVWWRRLIPKHVEHVALAVESEFAGFAANTAAVAGEVLYDFEKLLVIKSPLKLMIFCTKYSPGFRDLSGMRAGIWSALKQALLEYSHHIEGEKYLFFDTAVKGERNAWIVTIPASGSLADSSLTVEDIIVNRTEE